jgi:hypothetical protein
MSSDAAAASRRPASSALKNATMTAIQLSPA